MSYKQLSKHHVCKILSEAEEEAFTAVVVRRKEARSRAAERRRAVATVPPLFLKEIGTADKWFAIVREALADSGYEVPEADGDLRAALGAMNKELASRERRKPKASQRQGRKR